MPAREFDSKQMRSNTKIKTYFSFSFFAFRVLWTLFLEESPNTPNAESNQANDKNWKLNILCNV